MPKLADGHLSDENFALTTEATLKAQVRELAQEYTDKALRTLYTIMRNTKAPPGVRRQCAVDILNQGWGRPDSRGDDGGDKGTSRGLVINILKMGTGETVRGLQPGLALDLERVAGEAREAIEVAEEVLGQGDGSVAELE